MKLYMTTITPISNFATSLKGDTIFGQMCWALRFALGNEKLTQLLSDYATSPFMIISDGFPAGFLPKPTMPSALLGENNDDKKLNRKKIWLTADELTKGMFSNAKTDREIGNKNISIATIKNSLNYKTFITDDSGAFAPYSEEESALSPREIYILLDESKLTMVEFKKVFELFTQMGFGKNTTIGKGFFVFSDFKEVAWSHISKRFMTLSPCSLENQDFTNTYYEPFVRFGKHGASLANKNPFKTPLLLADTGAVVCLEKEQNLSYIGKAIQGYSANSETVHQGYAIVIPIGAIK